MGKVFRLIWQLNLLLTCFGLTLPAGWQLSTAVQSLSVSISLYGHVNCPAVERRFNCHRGRITTSPPLPIYEYYLSMPQGFISFIFLKLYIWFKLTTRWSRRMLGWGWPAGPQWPSQGSPETPTGVAAPPPHRGHSDLPHTKEYISLWDETTHLISPRLLCRQLYRRRDSAVLYTADRAGNLFSCKQNVQYLCIVNFASRNFSGNFLCKTLTKNETSQIIQSTFIMYYSLTIKMLSLRHAFLMRKN